MLGMLIIYTVVVFASSSLSRKKEREQMFMDQLDDKALRLYVSYKNHEIIERLK